MGEGELQLRTAYCAVLKREVEQQTAKKPPAVILLHIRSRQI